MPLPLVLGIIAAAAAAGGVSSGVVGAVKMKEANDTMKSAETRHKENIARFENQNKLTAKSMDELGAKEIAILATFEKFSNLFEQIQNRPEISTHRTLHFAIQFTYSSFSYSPLCSYGRFVPSFNIFNRSRQSFYLRHKGKFDFYTLFLLAACSNNRLEFTFKEEKQKQSCSHSRLATKSKNNIKIFHNFG